MTHEELQKAVNNIGNEIGYLTGYVFSNDYINNYLIDFLNSYGFDETLKSFKISIDRYFDEDNPKDTFSLILEKVGGILYNRRRNFEPKKWGSK